MNDCPQIYITKEEENDIITLKFSDKIGCSLNIINITTYFENLTVGLLYAFNTYVKFCDNKILFTIWSMRSYFIHNFKLQKLAI